MFVEVTRDAFQAMLSCAENSFPQEACGILLGEDLLGHRLCIKELSRTRNVHPSPETHFEIDPQALIEAHRAQREGGLQILGYFHSHPTGNPHPSAVDRKYAAHDGKIWAIVANNALMLWQDWPDCFHALSYEVARR